jgi:DNA-binding NarL/FixJ family response regulator
MRDFDNNQMLTYLTMLSDRSGLTGIGERMADRPQILTDPQAIVAQYTLLGYKQNAISEILDITPQAVNDHLKRVSPKANKV